MFIFLAGLKNYGVILYPYYYETLFREVLWTGTFTYTNMAPTVFTFHVNTFCFSIVSWKQVTEMQDVLLLLSVPRRNWSLPVHSPSGEISILRCGSAWYM